MQGARTKTAFLKWFLLLAGLALAAFADSAHAQITLRNKTEALQPSSSTKTISGAVPAGTVEGDLMIATVVNDEPGGDLTADDPSWILIEPATQFSSANLWTRSWYKVAGASEPASYGFTTTAAPNSAMIVHISTYYESSGVNVTGWTLEDNSNNYIDISGHG